MPSCFCVQPALCTLINIPTVDGGIGIPDRVSTGKHGDNSEMVTQLIDTSSSLPLSCIGELIGNVMPVDSGVKQMPAGMLNRYTGNPVLEPIPEHYWESKYVLNAGIIGLNSKVYMLYRAYGDDEVSRIGLAVSPDGFNFTERLATPIYEPGHNSELRGCEDPRLTLINDRIFMAYTAYDGSVAQIAIASIGQNSFVNYRWDRWERHGLFLPGCWDKDAAIFPEQFDGKFAMLHRLEPDMWISFSPDLSCPWSCREDNILAFPTNGVWWDARKIGAGAQPIKTKFGWLLITHGVDYANVYRLGVMLLDTANPRKLLYRSPNFILEPQTIYEVGDNGDSWVPNVVFSCGAIPNEDSHKILEADDEIIVYYGGADTVMNIATAHIYELIPECIRSECINSRLQ